MSKFRALVEKALKEYTYDHKSGTWTVNIPMDEEHVQLRTFLLDNGYSEDDFYVKNGVQRFESDVYVEVTTIDDYGDEEIDSLDLVQLENYNEAKFDILPYMTEEDKTNLITSLSNASTNPLDLSSADWEAELRSDYYNSVL